MSQHTSKPVNLLYFVAFVIAAVGICAGAYLLSTTGANVAVDHYAGVGLLTAGLAGLIGLLITYPIAAHLEESRRSATSHQEQLIDSFKDRLQQITVMLNVISEQQLLSDRAKVVAFRQKDREAIRNAIQEEMAKQDWEAAMALANNIDTAFGYKQEAEQFRRDINSRRQEVLHKQIAEHMVVVDRHIKGEAWGSALQEAHRIMQLFPGEESIQRLPQEIEGRRQQRKRQLYESWLDTKARQDWDGNMEILTKLDPYLTPDEAESMRQDVRNVLKEQRDSLKGQLIQAAHNNNLPEAIRLRDTIRTKFPNTKMAQEVVDVVEAVRRRLNAEPEAVKA